MKKAIFLDRDGVINRTVFRLGKPRAPYSLDEFEFIHGVKRATEKLKAHGFLLIVVTNQPDVARGWVDRAQVDLVNAYVKDDLGLDDLKACFHDDGDGCPCRKPKPGMLLEAAQQWDIDLPNSYMIGDRPSDVEAGQRAGCKSIWVTTPNHDPGGVAPSLSCSSLTEACDWILGRSQPVG